MDSEQPNQEEPIAERRKAGRPPGRLNKRTQALIDAVEQRWPDYDPVMAMIEIAHDEEADEQLRFRAHQEAARFLRPTLKPMEAPVNVENLLPQQGADLTAWTQTELMRIATRGAVTGDLSAAIAAHRLLADMKGTLKGGLKDADVIDMTEQEQEDAVLALAEEIMRKRGAK